MGIGFAVLVAVGICELILAGFWVGFYFRNGLPLYSRSIRCGPEQELPVSAEELSEAYSRWLVMPLDFRSLGPGEIAFREKLFTLTLLTYTPVMRGRIACDGRSGTLTVTGYANAWPLCFLGFFVTMSLQMAPSTGFGLQLCGVGLLIVALCYGIQALRYNRLVTMLREEVEAAGGG